MAIGVLPRSWRSASSRRRPAHARAPRRIIVLDDDPYLSFLLEQEFGAHAVTHLDTDSEGARASVNEADLLVVSEDHPWLDHLVATSRPPLLVTVDDTLTNEPRRSPTEEADGVLLRPFTPPELNRAVRGAMGLHLRGAGGRWSLVRMLSSSIGVLRVAAVLVAGLLLWWSGTVGQALVPLTVAMIYTAARAIRGSEHGRAVWADVTVAALLIAATGGSDSPYWLFGLVVAMEGGLHLRMSRAITAGLVVASGAIPEIIIAMIDGDVVSGRLVPWSLIFPLFAGTAAYGVLIRRRDGRAGVRLLMEANRVLANLYDIARAMPGGFEARSVASAALAEAKESLGAPAGVLLLQEAGLFSVAGSFGCALDRDVLIERRSLEGLVSSGPRPVEPHQLPDRLRSELDREHPWLAAPVQHGGAVVGLLLIAGRRSNLHEIDVDRLRQLADETGLAVANARLFGRIRDLSVDEERKRIASDLHDGTAQVLSHVRLELDLLGMHPDLLASVREDVENLGRVVERGQTDIRATISGLRTSITGEGVAASLHSYVRDVNEIVRPTVRCRTVTHTRLAPEVELELFRIAQECVSNALRHAQADLVEVVFQRHDDVIELSVIDDGTGFEMDAVSTDADGGLGLIAMRERALRIGAELRVDSQRGDGTTVTVRYRLRDTPLHPSTIDLTTPADDARKERT